MTRSLAIDLAPYGIIVNAIAPGWIDTRHNVETMATPEWHNTYIQSGRIPLRRPGKPEEIASTALALASEDCSYMTGQTLIVDGGMCLTL
jgi:NAD(P)-dependent dehydrogenase (short-subunit alcohol dehydrogenase family)